MDILDQIVAHKRKEVAARKKERSLSGLQSMPGFTRTCFSMRRFLEDDSRTGIIAEFKRRSPSKGWINQDANVNDVTGAYEKNGASGLSVLTDGFFFGGSVRDLEAARTNKLPVLRKDFMIDEYQFFEARAYGADAVLLIAACLSKNHVHHFAGLAKDLGMEVLLEVHNIKELDKICDEVDLVGINNRNLRSFEVDINLSLSLVDLIPKSKLAVAESGISDVETIVSLKQAGFSGFLIGENFMKHADPAIAFADFVKQLKAKT
jgi:indole-3-glycerol phosphate synthase